MAGLETITTHRLRGERLGPRHNDVLEPIFADPRVGATMGGVWSRAMLEQTSAAVDAHWSEHGFGYLMWFERATGEPIGRGGLSRTRFDGEPELGVGWTTRARARGGGAPPQAGAA